MKNSIILYYWYSFFFVVVVVVVDIDFVRGFSSPAFPQARGSASSNTISTTGITTTATTNTIISGQTPTSQLYALAGSKDNDRFPINNKPLLGIVASEKKKQQQQNASAVSSSSSSSSWNAFKDGIYDFVDFIRGGTDAVFLASSTTTTTTTTTTLEKSKSQMAVTYHDTVEQQATVTKNVPKSLQDMIPPTKKTWSKETIPVMKQYQSSLKTKKGVYPNVKINDMTSNGNENNRYPSKFRQTFDSAKDVLYGIMDSLTVTSSDKGKKKKSDDDDDDDDDDPFSFGGSVANTLEESKVAYKTSINQDKEVIAVSKYAPDLSSLNPVKRIQAKVAISSTQQQQQQQQQQEQQQQENTVTQGVKKVVFGFIDFFQTTQTTLRNLPMEVEKNVERTQDVIGRTVEEIQSTPKKIQQQVEGTKKSLQESQAKALQFVNDVQQVPKKVGDTVVGTVREVQSLPIKVQSSMEETQKSIETAREEVQSLVLETKYLTGLEKRPTPPPPPPRPKTSSEKAKELAVKVTKGTALFAGKASVVIVKGTVGMVASGVKLAWQATTSRRKKSVMGENYSKSDASTKYTSMRVSQSWDTAPKSIADIDPMLEKEVSEALLLAEAAVSIQERKENNLRTSLVGNDSDSSNASNSPIPAPVVSPNDVDINEAVKRAKAAAEQAKRNAEELEEMLNKRSVVKK